MAKAEESKYEKNKQNGKFEKKVKQMNEKYKAKKKVNDSIRGVKDSEEALSTLPFLNIDPDSWVGWSYIEKGVTIKSPQKINHL